MFSAQNSQVASSAANYIEDVFSTYLYTGTGATQTITNGIDLSGKGGLTWIKGRSGATDHALYDTVRGATFDLVSNSTAAQTTQSTGLTAFSSTGFSIGALAKLNTSAATYCSWTFREQAKFFDIVTYTGNGANRTIAHNLGSVPGTIIIKRTDTTAAWAVYHRSLANTEYLVLNTTAAKATGATYWNSTTPTSAVFSLGTATDVNASGGSATYVAYLFAHDAGGFGAAGTDNVISCGSYTPADGEAVTVNLGYEPQWVLIKRANSADNWYLMDIMRGMGVRISSVSPLNPNLSAAEGQNSFDSPNPTATGFISGGTLSVGTVANSFIYIAIRRGPMRTPTSGTQVYNAVTYSGSGINNRRVDTTLTPDLVTDMCRNTDMSKILIDRLRGNERLHASLANAGSSNIAQFPADTFNAFQTGVTVSLDEVNTSGRTYVMEAFRRAPGFFDVVCYTGTGANTSQTHNLVVAPELWIIKGRSGATAWQVGSTALANTEYLVLNTTAAKATGATRWNSTYPTASVFSLGTATEVNTSAATYVAYLFATVTGVSKVGSYTGNGTSLTVPCGFTAGARFVMIKRTDSTGDWYVWDTARGIVSGDDPHLSLNTTAAEVTTDDTIDPDNSGFIVNQVAATNVNVSNASYIFLAVS